MTGRVLDTLGMCFAAKGNFPVAREFYEQSIRYKQRWKDEAGIAVSHGQLGRLYLDWGHLDEAEHHFQEDLLLAQKLHSRGSEAQIYNHLGQTALARGEREAAAGKSRRRPPPLGRRRRLARREHPSEPGRQVCRLRGVRPQGSRPGLSARRRPGKCGGTNAIGP